jgi:hypothetical protein
MKPLKFYKEIAITVAMMNSTKHEKDIIVIDLYNAINSYHVLYLVFVSVGFY